MDKQLIMNLRNAGDIIDVQFSRLRFMIEKMQQQNEDLEKENKLLRESLETALRRANECEQKLIMKESDSRVIPIG